MKKTNQQSQIFQLAFSFVIPLIILSRFSAESKLGPTKSLLLALAFPIVYEIYGAQKRRKVSMFSVLAIGGILVTGAVSLLGLSEDWLALRRGIPYLAIAMAILISIKIKHPILNGLLSQALNMEKIKQAAIGKKDITVSIDKAIVRSGYELSIVFLAVAIASYILTRIVIISHTGSTGFNQEYARLRLLSLPIITLPMLIGVVIIFIRLTGKLEKFTGLKTDELIKEKVVNIVLTRYIVLTDMDFLYLI